jgi:hypothetical protein
MLNKKKFRDEHEDIIEIRPVNQAKPLVNKNFLFNKNTEEEISQIIVTQTSTITRNRIVNYRIFDLQNSNENIYVYNLHINPNQKLLSLFSQANFKYINLLPEYTKGENIIDMSVNEKEAYLLDCAEKLLEDLSIRKESERMEHIFYLDFEENDIYLFIILNFLKKIEKNNLHGKVTIVTNKSIMCVLSPGMNTILFSDNLFTKKGLGLLPLQKSIISTKGLRWDVQDWETDLGSLNLSTSNEFVEDECSIFIHSGCIAFTAEININKYNINI